MKFTGERYIPDDPDCRELKYEHESRYLFASSLVKEKKVADIGCGTGYGCKILADKEALHVVGTDISKESIGYAISNFSHKKILYAVSRVECLPLPDAEFDVVISFEVIEHLENYKEHLSEMKRILKDDGLLIISTPNVVKRADHSDSEKGDFHVHEFCFHDFKKLLSKFFESAIFFSQKYNQSIILEPFFEEEGNDRARYELVIDESFCTESPSEFEGDYIIGICGKSPGLAEKVVPQCKIYNISHTSRIHEMRRHIKELDEEIEELKKTSDERGKWAARLDKELSEKGKTIENLRNELEKSNAWALRISDELKELREKMQEAGILRKILKKLF